jgi:hypothetical protein
MIALSSRTHLLPLIVWGAVLAVLTFGAESQAQQKKKPPPPVVQAAQQEVKSKEAEILREAYILMAAANHNYDGHRVKAMHQVEEAVGILDKSIFKKGTNGQRVLALKEDIAAAQAKFIAQHSAKEHEPQALSDLQMREAGAMLLNVRGALEKNQQGKVLHHVDEAIKQVNIALKIR